MKTVFKSVIVSAALLAAPAVFAQNLGDILFPGAGQIINLGGQLLGGGSRPPVYLPQPPVFIPRPPVYFPQPPLFFPRPPVYFPQPPVFFPTPVFGGW
jgi:hypothetical protein